MFHQVPKALGRKLRVVWKKRSDLVRGFWGQKTDGQATQVQAVRASHFLSSISLLVLEDVLPEAPPFTLQYFLPSLHFVTSVLCVAIVCHGFPHFISWVKLVGLLDV